MMMQAFFYLSADFRDLYHAVSNVTVGVDGAGQQKCIQRGVAAVIYIYDCVHMPAMYPTRALSVR